MNSLTVGNTETRDKILRLQDSVAEMPQVDCPVAHYFAPGLYAREIFIPAGSVVVGKIHRHAHVNTISKGRCLVTTEFGSEELVAPTTFISIPGTKRAVYALEDVIWTTYHPTVVCDVVTDLAQIESEVIAPSYDDVPAISYSDMKGLIQ